MDVKKALVAIASNSESVKSRLSAVSLELNYPTTTISPSELLRMKEPISEVNSTIILFDVTGKLTDETLKSIQKFSHVTHQPLLLYSENNMTRNGNNSEFEDMTYITKRSSTQEIELKLKLLEQKIELQRFKAEHRRDDWMSKALLRLYQETTDTKKTLDATLGIVSTVLGLPCCILANGSKDGEFQVTAFAGITSTELDEYFSRKTTAYALAQIKPRFLEISTFDPPSMRQSAGKRPLQWEPGAGLVTAISREMSPCQLFCVFSKSRRPFRDHELVISMRGAFFASTAIAA